MTQKQASAKNPPPACNTGVENKIVSQRIHWLEVTFKPVHSKKLPDSLPKEGTECYPLHGYNVGTKFSDGRMEFTHTQRPDMGIHIQWDGTSLDQLNMPVMSLVEFLLSAGATFTRIDLATDAIGYGLRASDATEHIKNRDFKCRCKKTPAWFDPTFGGWTQYLGTNASEIHLRIYDKAAEMGTSGDHTRVELVVKGKRANKAAEAIVRGADFRELVAGYATFPKWKAWAEVMAANAVTLQAEKKDTATDLWLLSQCAKTLARRLDELGDDELWFRFLDQVRANRKC